MSQENNGVLTALILLERLIPRLHANSRETIRRSNLLQFEQSISLILKSLTDECEEPLVLTPLVEVVTLIDTVTSEPTFVETDDETKRLLVDRISSAQYNLLIYAGKYYMTHEFTYNISQNDILVKIVNTCIDANIYFGYDVQLRQEGAI